MRVVFFGTPEFATVALSKLMESDFDVALVVTQPDRPRDRGNRLLSPPVKELAVQLGIPVLQPEYLKGNNEFFDQLKSVSAAVFVVVAYGRILPREVLAIPALGCINIHASLLPVFRGAAPIQRAVMAGEAETGVTLMYMSEEMDAGDIITSRSTVIGDKSALDLFAELSLMGAELLVEELPKVARGQTERIAQDHSLATYAPMVRKEEGHLDFHRPAEELERIVRGMDAQSGAYVYYKGKTLKIWEGISVTDCGRYKGGNSAGADAGLVPGAALTGADAGLVPGAALTGADAGLVPGTVLAADEEGIVVSARTGALRVTALQSPGKKILMSGEFLRGNRIDKGDVFY